MDSFGERPQSAQTASGALVTSSHYRTPSPIVDSGRTGPGSPSAPEVRPDDRSACATAVIAPSLTPPEIATHRGATGAVSAPSCTAGGTPISAGSLWRTPPIRSVGSLICSLTATPDRHPVGVPVDRPTVLPGLAAYRDPHRSPRNLALGQRRAHPPAAPCDLRGELGRSHVWPPSLPHPRPQHQLRRLGPAELRRLVAQRPPRLPGPGPPRHRPRSDRLLSAAHPAPRAAPVRI
jgi:hypothetical protein